MSIIEEFESIKNDNRYNTSYPLSPEDWKKYEVEGKLKMDESNIMSFYIHIPFCKSLCKFCEYTRDKLPSDISMIDKYIETLKSDVDKFLKSYNHKLWLVGFDIGGGTPTSLPYKQFNNLMELYKRTIKNNIVRCDSSSFIPSIESTFQSIDKDKIDLISNSGLKRISFGVQSSSRSLVKSMGRNSNTDRDDMIKIIRYCKKKGLIVNLDFMYGLSKNPTYESILKSVADDIGLIKRLNPDQVTLYEFRSNMVSNCNVNEDKDSLYLEYYSYFHSLKMLGYKSNFGMNTFSKNKWDLGLSSYLRNRMINGVQYKGFGISAQSMSRYGISYNIGKNSKCILDLINKDTYESSSYYNLPSYELVNKFISISAYSGRIYLPGLNNFMDLDEFLSDNEAKINYFKKLGYIKVDNIKREIRVTEDGFKYYGAIFRMLNISE